MPYFSRGDLTALEATATTAATYLDACDTGAFFVRLDPAHYLACASLLTKILFLLNADKDFSSLTEQSAAAHEISESIQIGQRIELNSQVFYPELTVLLNRAAAE